MEWFLPIFWGNSLAVVIFLAAVAWQFLFRSVQASGEEATFQIGDITDESLRYYNGYDYMKPILVAVKGKVFDVTDRADVFGPGKALHIFSGKEVSRALAKGSSALPEDFGSAQLHDLGEETETQKLEEKLLEMIQAKKPLPLVGQVVPLKEIHLEELRKHDGNDTSLPMYLSIEGTVYNISKGSQFYGPGGVYPFAGHECARAFALMSTEASDCNANLEGLTSTELETLRDWKAKFNTKYPIVGKIVV